MNLILMFSSMRLAPHLNIQPSQDDVVALRRSTAYKKQYCVPPCIRECFEAYSYLCECLDNYIVAFSAPDSRWVL